MTDIIYKIVPAGLWAEAEKAGVFGGAPIDLSDGYIHFSTAAQARRTAELYFKGQDDLLLVAVDGDVLAGREVGEGAGPLAAVAGAEGAQLVLESTNPAHGCDATWRGGRLSTGLRRPDAAVY